MRRASAPIGFAILVLTVSSPALAEPQRTFTYRCDDGTVLAASFSQKPARATLHLGGKRIVLPQGRSGSGARYVKGRIVFWIKGRDAMLSRGSKEITCHTQ